jgi:hypothetical protein
LSIPRKLATTPNTQLPSPKKLVGNALGVGNWELGVD